MAISMGRLTFLEFPFFVNICAARMTAVFEDMVVPKERAAEAPRPVVADG